jgi:dihydropteroate synthase
MLGVVAASDVDVVLQHWRGHSADMYARAAYADLARDLVAELEGRVGAAAAAGISPDRIILDPGIGFGKRGAQNWEALRALEQIVAIGPRVLVGTSRKRFLAEALADAEGVEVSTSRRDLATAVTSVLATQAGAWAVRVHDVAATRDALTVWSRWNGENDGGGA